MVHTFFLLGQYIAVDVNSGAVHILDRLTYDVLEQMQDEHTRVEDVIAKLPQYSAEEIREGYEELQGLVSRGELFAAADYINPALAVIKNAPVKALRCV